MLKHIALLISVTMALVFSILFTLERGKNNPQRINFELLDTTNGVATHKDLWGKWSVITFGFTSCPDVCPTHASRIGSAMYQLAGVANAKAPAERIQAVFISVDYLRDNAESLDKYIKYFHPDYVGYLGNPQQLDQVTKSFNVAYSVTKGEGDSVEVLHSSLIYIIDPYGRIAKTLPFGSSTNFIISEVKNLM